MNTNILTRISFATLVFAGFIGTSCSSDDEQQYTASLTLNASKANYDHGTRSISYVDPNDPTKGINTTWATTDKVAVYKSGWTSKIGDLSPMADKTSGNKTKLDGNVSSEGLNIGDRTEHIRPDKIFKDGVAVIDAGMTIGDFAELTGIELPDGPYETVAGYVMAKTGTMGYEGEILHSDDGYDMVVTKVDRRRIETIEVRKTENGKTVREKSEEKSEETA